MSKREAAGCGAGCWALAVVAMTKSVATENNTWGKVCLRIFILSLLCSRIALDYTTANTLPHITVNAGFNPQTGASNLSFREVTGFNIGIFWMVKTGRRLAAGSEGVTN